MLLSNQVEALVSSGPLQLKGYLHQSDQIPQQPELWVNFSS